MTRPIKIEIPHKLGLPEARRRIDQGIGQLASVLPGSTVNGGSWHGDTMVATIEAMGQRVSAQFVVAEDRVHATLDLPPVLSLLASRFKAAIGEAGAKLLR